MSNRSFVGERAKLLESSGIRRAFDLAATMKDPINLSIGQPDFPVPDAVKREMNRAINENQNGYTPTRGIPALRDRLARRLQEEFDWSPDLFVTSGVSGGLHLALTACVNPGDEVLFGDPYFVSYPQLVLLAGGKPVTVDLYDDFQLHPERFAAAITPKSKIIILSSPGNPTGIVHREPEVRALCELARKHDLLIISDEIYCTLTYDGPSPSPVRFAPERTMLLRGFGKSYAMTGLRIGYAAGPADVIKEMAKLQQYTFVCAPEPAQHGAVTALNIDMSLQVAQYRAKRDLICRELHDVVDFVRPTGGFYLFPKIPPRFADAGAFIEEAQTRKLIIIPGEVFSGRNTHFRVSYAAPDAKLRAGCAVIRDLAR